MKCWFSRFSFNRFNEFGKDVIILCDEDIYLIDEDDVEDVKI
jgi:predicted RNA-binding protein associated with RNAse of E/G family